MIRSYRDKPTVRFASGIHVKAFSGFARQAEIRLDRLDAANSLQDLAALRGNRLEALKVTKAVNTASVSMINGGSVLSGTQARQGQTTSK